MNKDTVTISRKTAIASITGLRAFYRELNEELESYEHQSGCYSIVISIESFIKQVETAYKELQRVTNDNTPIEIKE